MFERCRRAAAAALVVAVAACAMPLQPDLQAKAPDLPGFGHLLWNVRTPSREHPLDTAYAEHLRSLVDAAVLRLRAEIAAAAGRHDEALQLQAQAVTASKHADDNEPPMLAAGARLALGELQLRAGQAAAAEATLRADLGAQPGSGWALSGLGRALAAQGHAEQARSVQGRLAQAWPTADTALVARR